MKKGAMSWQMILLILAVIALITVGYFLVTKPAAAKDFFANLIKGIMGKYEIG